MITTLLAAWGLACLIFVAWACVEIYIGRDSVDRDEDPLKSTDRVTTIKAALQDESTAHPHVSARNYWSKP
jgi:hypothetical protein